MSQQFILDCRYSRVIKVENIRVSNCIPFQLSQEKQNKIPYANTDQNIHNLLKYEFDIEFDVSILTVL